MQIEVPAIIIQYIVVGWLFVLGVAVLDAIDRRAHRANIYDLMKLNLSAIMENMDTDRLIKTKE